MFASTHTHTHTRAHTNIPMCVDFFSIFLPPNEKSKIITSLISTRFLLLYQPLQSIFDFMAEIPLREHRHF